MLTNVIVWRFEAVNVPLPGAPCVELGALWRGALHEAAQALLSELQNQARLLTPSRAAISAWRSLRLMDVGVREVDRGNIFRKLDRAHAGIV